MALPTGCLGVGFALILGVTGRFHFAYAFTYTLAAYMAFTFKDRVGLPFWVAVVAGIVVGRDRRLGDRALHLPAARGASRAPPRCSPIFVASLGIGIAGENLIRLLWGSSSQNLTRAQAGRVQPCGT